MTIVWIGMVVPSSFSAALAAADRYVTAQTQKFQQAVIAALEGTGENQVRLVSSPPMTDWSTIVFTGLKRWSHRGDARSDWVVPLVNVIGLKQLCVFLGCFLFCTAAVWRSGRKGAVIVVGDSYLPHLFAAWLTSRICFIKSIAIVTDLPGLIAVADPWYKRMLRPLDNFAVKRAIGSMDGLVVLSKHVAVDYFPTKQFMVMPGIFDLDGVATGAGERSPAADEFVVMYSGALVQEYGIDLLLAAFALLRGEEYQLWITGKGDSEPAIRAAAHNDKRIHYYGYLSDLEMQARQQRANVLVNLRISHQGHARYSFPSKLFNYMSKERFVLSNRFPSLPDEYARHLIMLDEETPSALANVLSRLKAGAYGDMREFGRSCRDFILREASAVVQGARLDQFVREIGRATPPRT